MSDFQWVAFAAVTILSGSRLTRLLTFDKFPPVMWLRKAFIEYMDKGPRRRQWQLLAFCAYCASFWCTLAVVLLALWAGVLDGEVGASAHSGWAEAWWIVNGSLAASYLAAVFMVHDGDDSNDGIGA